MQPDLFSAPVHDVTTTSPAGEARPPIAGRTITSRHASATGAEAVETIWTIRQSAYLQLLQNAGGLTDKAAAALLGCDPGSVCSVRNALGDRIVADGFEDGLSFTDVSGRERVTRRTRWTIAR